ncbi:MAG: ATPase domain-containing protein [Nitrososphaerota archaeon]
MEESEHKLLKTLNDELDRRIGGIILPALVIIEGPNDSGKSVLVQQFTYGALETGYKVCIFSTEGGGRAIVRNMESLGFSVKKHYLRGHLRVVPLSVREEEWTSDDAKQMLVSIMNYVQKKSSKFNIICIDSLTVLITGAREEDVLRFFSEMRSSSEEYNLTYIVTIHPYAFSQEFLVRIRSISDAHFSLMIKEIGDKIYKTLQILKVRGASKPSSQVISFEVDPSFGIKILPFSQVKA